MLTIIAKLRRLCLFIILLFVINTLNAQTEINTGFSDRMNYIFQLLEKNRVPDGLLLDYAMEFTNLPNFNGASLTDSNMVMPAEFFDIYNTLYLSRIHSNGFTIQNPHAFDSLWYNQRGTGKIVLAGLFYNYSRLKDDALSSNLITVQNEQLIDRYINGIWQNPYQSEKIFAISPSLEFYEGKNLQVVLPAGLWQTNAAGIVSTISIDLEDGQGYRTLSIGQPLTLSYADTGMKIWKYRLQLINGQYLYSHSQVKIKKAVYEATPCSGCRFGNSNPETIPFTADEAYEGIQASGFITIRYRDADLGLRRPLIVAEGFDAGHIISPELQFGTSTITDFFNNVNIQTSGSGDIDDVIRNFPEYDIIYVDWRNGTDFLQRNGRLLQTIIRWVNNNKEPLPDGSYADNVVLGVSMGGVISRWALRDMETRLNQQHHTRLFISMDAPQQGANVPVSYQHLAKHARNIYLQTNISGTIEFIQFLNDGPSPFRALSIADRPASRQMLKNWVTAAGNIDNSIHDQWQTELRNIGYPTQNNIRNIAISNGTECGTTQPFSPGAELLNLNGKGNTRFIADLLGQIAFPLAGSLLNQGGFYLGILPGRNELKYEFIANAQPNQGVTQRIYKGKISYTKKILWLIPVTVTITDRERNSDPTLLPTDYYGGGEINTGINDFNLIQTALVKFNTSLTHIPTFCFIPTPSALDIGLNNIALNNTDYLAKYIGGAPPVSPRNTPFQNFVTAFNQQRRNEQHVGFFQRNGDWTAQELTQIGNPPPNPPITNCSAFCENGIITGNTTVCTSQILTAPFGNGVTYNWSVNSSIVTLTPNGNTVLVTRNGTGTGNAIVTVNISGACGNSILSTPILVSGIPDNTQLTIVGVTDNQMVCPNVPVTLAIGSTYGLSYKCSLLDAQWNVSVSGAVINYNSGNGAECNNNTGVTITFPNLGYTYTAYIQARVQNSCGWSNWFPMPMRRVQVNSNGGNCGGGGWMFLVSPNPATNTIAIEQNDKSITGISEISVFDQIGNLKKQLKYSNGSKQIRLNISDLKNGIYFIEISSGQNKERQQLIIQK